MNLPRMTWLSSAGSIFSILGNSYEYELPADGDAIASDWQTVGDDLRLSMETFRKSNPSPPRPMKPPAAFRLSPQSLALVTQYSQLIGCTPAEFLNRFLDDYLVELFTDSRNAHEFICTFQFRTRADADRVINWLRESIGQTGCLWDIEAEALEEPEGTFKVAAALTKGGQMYQIG
jgi:hypothetical protein